MILVEPIKTEKAIGKIEFNNKITFRVGEKSTKKQIKEEVEKIFSVKVHSVKTYLTQKGQKRAIVRLADGYKAEDISSKLKMA